MKTYYFIIPLLFYVFFSSAQEMTFYDFENMSTGTVEGQDNWQVLGCHTYQPTITNSNNQGLYNGSQVLQIISTDVELQHSNCDRLNDENWWVPSITDSSDFLIVDIDMTGGYWGKEFSLCYDKNLDGNFTENCNTTDTDEKGIKIIKTTNSFKLYNGATLLAQDNNVSEWAKYRLVIDLNANDNLGSISVYHKNLSTNVWNEFENMQNIQANFNFEADNGSNPTKYNGMKIENEAGSTASFDNIKLLTFDKIQDYFLCYNEEINIELNIPEASYEWHDGSTNNFITLDEGGLFFVKIILDNHIAIIDSFNVTYEDYLVDLGEDIILCPNQTISIGLEHNSDFNYNWNTGQDTSNIDINQEGEYFVEVNSQFCNYYDTLVVSNFSYSLELGNDTTICENSSIFIGPSYDASVEYLWNTGSNQNVIEAFDSQTYFLKIIKDGCIVSDTIDILKYNSIKLENDTILCNENTYVISVNQEYDSYQWNNGSANYYTTISNAGKYWVETEKNGCRIYSDTINVSYDYTPTFNTNIQDFILCNREQIPIKLNANNYDEILWYDNSNNDLNIISSPGLYWVIISNKCGSSTEEFEVNTKNCNCYAFVPNTFTPNSDNQNDKLEIKTDCIPTIYDLAIYNRWGGIVFKSKDYKEYWDGKFNGSYCTDGVYTLKLSIKYDNESFKTYTKRITLMK